MNRRHPLDPLIIDSYKGLVNLRIKLPKEGETWDLYYIPIEGNNSTCEGKEQRKVISRKNMTLRKHETLQQVKEIGY